MSAERRPQRPGRLAIGDRVRLAGTLHTVIAVAGTAVRLAGSSGVVTEMSLAQLLMSEGFEMVSASSRPPLPPSTPLDGLPEAVAAEALWWERHIVEVLRGVPPQAPAGTRPKPEYDPAAVSLTRREQAKAAELTAAGRPVTASAIAKRRRRYEARGVAGMADHRTGKPATPHGRADPAVVEAMRQAIAEADAGVLADGDLLVLADRADPGGCPRAGQWWSCRHSAVFTGCWSKLSAGKHTTGSARTRRSLADRPDGPFGEADAWAPGEMMQMDSTPLDVLVRLDDGVAGRVDLTGMIDVATRTVTAAVLRPTTKSVDASVLLARTVTPEPMRPGWADALAMSRSALPWQRLLDIDARMEHAAARPVIIPETIVVDHGKGVHLPQLPGLLQLPGHQLPARPRGVGLGEGPHRADAGVGGLAVRPVRGRIQRVPMPNAGAGAPGSRRCGPCWSCRSFWMSGSWRPGRTVRMTGSATRPIPGGRSPRTRSTPPWWRRPATSRSRCRPGITSNCCPRPGGRSTPTA